MMGVSLVERACAKINLGLKVLHRRDDGYHEIRSIMQTVDLADSLHFGETAPDGSPLSGSELTCSDPDLSTGADNLVLRALELFHAHLEQPSRPFRIHLEKQIPMGAGLGGGSADAAATLRGLNRLYGNPFPTERLRRMAAEIGSDIPFLIEGGTALAAGRGEILTPLDWHGRVFYVLVYPEVVVGTAWAYAQLRPDLTAPDIYLNFIASLSGGCVDLEALIDVLENDFQPVVERAYPIVANARAHIDQSGARASSMSGSGSTVYGIFDDRTIASQAHQELQAQGYRSFLCHPASPGAQGASGERGNIS